jgi:hypothetical protein
LKTGEGAGLSDVNGNDRLIEIRLTFRNRTLPENFLAKVD